MGPHTETSAYQSISQTPSHSKDRAIQQTSPMFQTTPYPHVDHPTKVGNAKTIDEQVSHTYMNQEQDSS